MTNVCSQLAGTYNKLQLIPNLTNRQPPQKRLSNSIDEEPEPYVYITQTEHEPNFLKST